MITIKSRRGRLTEGTEIKPLCFRMVRFRTEIKRLTAAITTKALGSPGTKNTMKNECHEKISSAWCHFINRGEHRTKNTTASIPNVTHESGVAINKPHRTANGKHKPQIKRAAGENALFMYSSAK